MNLVDKHKADAVRCWIVSDSIDSLLLALERKGKTGKNEAAVVGRGG